MRRIIIPAVVIASIAIIAGCPAPPKGPGGAGGSGGGGGGAINPDACGTINASKVGRKLYAFLKASAALDKASIGLEASVHESCVKMATELGVPTDGDTRTVCKRAVKTLDEHLAVSVKTESRLVTRHTPPVCKTEIGFAAGIVAECEATVAADVNITCEGSCGGSCSGQCDGTCASTNASGECAGQCDGVCRGSCSADCNGYASVDASAECKASAEISATVNTTCSEPKVEVVREDVTIVDTTKFDQAMAAIDAGLPNLLRVGAQSELVAKAIIHWSKTLGGLVKSSGQLVGELGERGVCVGIQLANAFAAVAQVEARVSISIEVSAEVSASAGATEQ